MIGKAITSGSAGGRRKRARHLAPRWRPTRPEGIQPGQTEAARHTDGHGIVPGHPMIVWVLLLLPIRSTR